MNLRWSRARIQNIAIDCGDFRLLGFPKRDSQRSGFRTSPWSFRSGQREIAYAVATIEPALYRCDCFLWSLQTGAGRPDSRSHRILVESTSIGEMFEVQS